MHHRTTLAGTALLTAALVLTGCSSGPEEATAAAPSSSSAAFPVTLEHAFGETTIAEEPQRVAELDSDILLSYASTQAEADAFAAQPYTRTIPAVATGHHATLVGDELVAAVSPPTVLSMTWGLDDYLTALSAAA